MDQSWANRWGCLRFVPFHDAEPLPPVLRPFAHVLPKSRDSRQIRGTTPPAFASRRDRTSTETPWIVVAGGFAAKNVIQPADSFAGALMLSKALLYRLSQAFLSWLGLVLEFAAGHGEVIAKCGECFGQFVEERGLLGVSVLRLSLVVSVSICGHALCHSEGSGDRAPTMITTPAIHITDLGSPKT
jgi:hypothetical protein